jgi:hypothetical protein
MATGVTFVTTHTREFDGEFEPLHLDQLGSDDAFALRRTERRRRRGEGRSQGTLPTDSVGVSS